MRNLKRFAALGLASAMLLSMAACGSTEEGKSSEASQSAEASKSTTPASESKSEVPEEPVVLTCWVPEIVDLDDPMDWDACATTTVLEEMFNVDLQFVEIPPAEDMATQYNLKMTSGKELPDIFLTMNFNTTMITNGAEAGLLLPLTDYIVEGTAYYERLEEYPAWRDMFTAPDGNIYTFMYAAGGEHTMCFSKMWYRAEWMEKLGWDTPPSTPEEFKQYLMDIRDQDVNGNGDSNDEIPMMGFYGGRMSDPICYLMNPFELYVPNYHYITDDGELKFVANTDGWRKGLAYIADLYAEGLIAEETYVQDQATFRAILNKTPDEALIGTIPFWRVAGDLDMSVEGNNFVTYASFAPLKGDYQQNYYDKLDIQYRGAINTNCEHPDLAFKIMDYLISEEGSIMMSYGPEGGSWEWSNEFVNYLGTTPAITKKPEIENILSREYRWYTGAPLVDDGHIRYSVALDESNLENDQQWELYHFSQPYIEHGVRINIPYSSFVDEDLKVQKDELLTLFNSYIETADTEFVMGIRDINDDAQWEAYLKDLEDMGLQEYLEVLNNFYGLK